MTQKVKALRRGYCSPLDSFLPSSLTIHLLIHSVFQPFEPLCDDSLLLVCFSGGKSGLYITKKQNKTYGVENLVASAAVLLVIQCPHPLSRWALRQQRDEFTVCPPVAMQTGECGARAAQEHNWRGGCCRLGTVRALFTDKRRGAHNPSLHLHKFTICCCLYFSPHSGAFAQLLIKSHQVSFKRGFIPSCFPFHIILLNTLQLQWVPVSLKVIPWQPSFVFFQCNM